MKKNKVVLSKAKRAMILSTISSLTKTYDGISESCTFAMSKEKRVMNKSDVKISQSLIINFFDGLSEAGIVGNDVTILNFCRKSCDLLIAKTAGNDRIRGLTIVSDNIKEQLKTIDESQQDDSQLLMNRLG